MSKRDRSISFSQSRNPSGGDFPSSSSSSSASSSASSSDNDESCQDSATDDDFVEDDALNVAICCSHNSLGDQRWDECRELLQSPDAPRLVNHRDRFGDAALHWASYNNVPMDIVQTIHAVSPSLARLRDAHGYAPLHVACACASEEIVAFLLAAAPETAAIPVRRGDLPLHKAVHHRRRPSLVRRVLAAHPAAVRSRDSDGATPLRVFGVEWCRVLLEEGPDGLDGDDARTLSETLDALLRAFDPDFAAAPGASLLRTTLRHHASAPIPPVVVASVHRRATLAERLLPDPRDDGNLLLHAACALGPYRDDGPPPLPPMRR